MSVLIEKIEAATNDMLLEPDWAKNMEICDLVARDPTLGSPTVKTLRTRLKAKNVKVQILALSLLEALIKNCPKIHPHVADRDFMSQLVKMVKKKSSKSRFSRLGNNDALSYEDNERIDKTLILIQLLGQEFANSASFPIFRQTYQDLVREGVRFPEPLKDEGAPIFTPPAQPAKPKPVDPRPDLHLTKAEIGDRQLAAAQENAVLLYTMLDSSDKGPEELKKDETLSQIARNVRTQQEMCVNSLRTPLSEDKVADTLAANDTCLQALSYYDGLLNGKLGRKIDLPPDGENASGDSDFSDGEYSDQSPDEKEIDDDFLGLDLNDSSSSKVKKSKPKKKSSSSHKRASKKIKPIPKLAPPKETKKSSSSSRGAKKKQQQNDNVVDLLDLDTLGDVAGGGDDFFSSFPEPEKSPKPNKRQTVQQNDDDEFDEFFAIASRHKKKAEPQQHHTNKQAGKHKQHLNNGRQQIHQPTGGGHAPDPSNPFDPLY